MTEHRDYLVDGMAVADRNVGERQRSAYCVRVSDVGERMRVGWRQR
jgi:hypothetical protein